MSLQFVIGSPGSGKSTTVYNRIIKESIDNPKRNYIIIVPEQFTMMTQKELVRLHPSHVIMNIDVLSFNRLAYRVFDELGIKSFDVLEETGKNLVIRKLSMLHQDELDVLKPNINKVGYINEIKSFISELAQYNISSDEFGAVIKEGDFNPHFIKKATDINIIYKAYEDFIKDRYITAESLLIRLNEVVADSKFLNDSVFVFDGFTGFTPLQNELLYTILPRINKAYIVVTMDAGEPLFGDIRDYELFNMSKKMIAKTARICEKCNVDIEDEQIICKKNYRFKPGGYIDYIEKTIFRGGNPIPYASDESADTQKADDISQAELSIHLLANPRQEIEFVAARISDDIRNRGFRYKDIAVCAADIGGYKEYFDSIFSRYNIPYYLDATSEITFHPLVEFIRSALLIVETNFSYEAVIQFLRCGLSDISIDDVDSLDNYLSVTKIRGVKAYEADYTYEPDSYKGKLDAINDIRRRFISPLIQFADAITDDADALTISRSLYKLLCDYQVEDKINNRADEFERAGDNIKSAEYTQVYKLIISILDKIVAIIGDDVITPKEYMDILLSALEAAKVSTIPIAQDCVVIGDLERTRYDKPKVMYVMGVNDGVIPAGSHSKGIISQTERMALKSVLESRDSDLAPTDRERSFMQRFYVYMIMTKASDRLCITYSATGVKSEPLERSYLIDEILQLFADIKVEAIDNIRPSDWIVTYDSTKRYVASSIRSFVHDSKGELQSNRFNDVIHIIDMDDEMSMQALLAFAGNNELSIYDSIYAGAFYYHNSEKVDRALYDRLIDSKHPTGSVSKLESYRRCAYNYFLNYCLKIRQKEQSRLQSLDYGSIYHDILEEFSNGITESDSRWSEISEDMRQDILEKACDKVYSEYNRMQLLDTPRENYILDKIKTTMDKTTASLIEQSKHTKFEPYRFEVELNEVASYDELKVKLQDGRDMTLTGRIDRIDTYNEGDTVYVKIIDYKSGNNDINYEKVYNGLQLQLIYYLDVAVRGMSSSKADGDVHKTKQVKPAAMFYYRVKDPIVQYAKDSIDELIKREMMPKGVFFDEIDDDKYEAYKNSKDYREDLPYDSLKVLRNDVAKALDVDCTDKSVYAPLGYTKDGELSGIVTKALSINDIERLEKHIRDKMSRLGSDMYEGVIDAKPVQDEGCTYCPYGSICGFDIKTPGYEYSDYTKLGRNKQEEIFSLID